MSTEEKLKICVECRAMVPQDATECLECGYPFDDTGVSRCKTCNSVIVDDVQTCPVCGQEIEQLQEAQEPQEPEPYVAMQAIEEETPPLAPPPTVPLETAPCEPPQEGQSSGADYGAVISSRLDTINYALHELASAIQSNNKINDDILRIIKESSQDVRNSISENQAANQRVLQETMDIIKVAYESLGAKNDTASSEQITEVKAAIADVAAQQTTSASLVITAIKENAAKPVSSPTIELPSSLKWLDYMFIAIVVALIFSMGNLLVMAYVARLIMSFE